MRFIKPVTATLLALAPLCTPAAFAQSVLMSTNKSFEVMTVTPVTAGDKTGNCKVNCGSADDGYAWAADVGIASPASCPEGSKEFVKGCKYFAEKLIRDSENMEREEQGLLPLPAAVMEPDQPTPPAPEPAPPPPKAAPTETPEPPAPLPPPEPVSQAPKIKPHESTLLLSMPDEPAPPPPAAPTPDPLLSQLPPAELPTMKRQGEEQPVGTTVSIGRVR